MKQNRQGRREAAQVSAPNGNSPDPALAALVRYLARAAAERDYAVSRSAGGPEEGANGAEDAS